MNPSLPRIQIRGLSVQFQTREVLTGIDLDLFPDCLTVLVGPSGSGKTTLLRSINRLNEEFAHCRTTGSVILQMDDGPIDIYSGKFPLPEIRRRIGMVFQAPSVLPFSIARNILMPIQVVLECTGTEARDRMEFALKQAMLWKEVNDRLDKPAMSLSGGQQQRLCLARALALEPLILLLDEPTASLDYRSAEKIEALLQELKRKYTLVAVSHSLGQTLRIADHVCVIRDGRLAREMDRSILDDDTQFRSLMAHYF